MIPKTASCIVIGDEILTGKVQDTNSHALAKIMFNCGVELQKIETISDGIDLIADTVRAHAREYDYVFTSGGIGPTHDDLTYEGVAAAFGLETALDHDALAKMAATFEKHPEKGGEMNAARERMCVFPVGAELLPVEDLWVPVVVVQNVHVLPGVPWLFGRMVRAVSHRFVGVKKTRKILGTTSREGDLAVPLGEVQEAHPDVSLGSYPQPKGAKYRVKLTVEAHLPERVEEVASIIMQKIENVEPIDAEILDEE